MQKNKKIQTYESVWEEIDMTSPKNYLSACLSALVFLLAAGPVSGQGRLAIEQVKDGLHVITGPGGNIGVRLTDDGVILIDDKFPEDFEEIQSLVASVTDMPVKYVINTHHHGDHSGSNASFLQSAEVIAHKNARDNIIRNNQEGAPRIIFMDETAVFLGGVEVQAFHLGTGHTNGDAVVYFADLNTIHGGDLLHTTAPFIDYANGGSSKGWVDAVNGILKLDFDTAIPGHGPVMDRRFVINFRNQMEAVRQRMAGLIRNGLRAEDAADAIRDAALSWTQAENGLFMSRSIPGFYAEIAAELE